MPEFFVTMISNYKDDKNIINKIPIHTWTFTKFPIKLSYLLRWQVMNKNNNRKKTSNKSKRKKREIENLSVWGIWLNIWGFLEWDGSVFKKKASAHSSFYSSDKMKAWPNPSKSPSLCHSFFFSSIESSNKVLAPLFIFFTKEVLTPWLTSLNDFIIVQISQKHS